MDVRLVGGQLVSEELMTLGGVCHKPGPSSSSFSAVQPLQRRLDAWHAYGELSSLPEEWWRAVVGRLSPVQVVPPPQLKANFRCTARQTSMCKVPAWR
ncbi:zinc finger homeobox protein 3 [Lates japonicus]|uniref:Zinc finger homeobox protein 3 n=1 Tax=Lates japonicus TaxID=270547 RepID=A0AAD3QWZ4_LATJO|nr:zinc finger homeobox protein 3 [Lates japonicus]